MNSKRIKYKQLSMSYNFNSSSKEISVQHHSSEQKNTWLVLVTGMFTFSDNSPQSVKMDFKLKPLPQRLFYIATSLKWDYIAFT